MIIRVKKSPTELKRRNIDETIIWSTSKHLFGIRKKCEQNVCVSFVSVCRRNGQLFQN